LEIWLAGTEDKNEKIYTWWEPLRGSIAGCRRVATTQLVLEVSERLSLKRVEREKESSHLTISHSESMRVP